MSLRRIPRLYFKITPTVSVLFDRAQNPIGVTYEFQRRKGWDDKFIQKLVSVQGELMFGAPEPERSAELRYQYNRLIESFRDTVRDNG